MLGRTLGGAAVLLFFVLSGLLISYSLLNKVENPKYGFSNYFVDRFSRIYSGLVPAMLFGIVIVILIYKMNYTYYENLLTMQSPPSLLSFGMTLGMLERFPVDFFNSVFTAINMPITLPEVTPFGFNGILWTLVIEWWTYLFFGALTLMTFTLIGKRQKSIIKNIFLAIALALLSLVIAAMFQQNSGLIIAWFVGVLVMLTISNESINKKISDYIGTKALETLFTLSLASAVIGVYLTFAWTYQYYDLHIAILIASCLFLGVTLLNQKKRQAPKIFTNKKSIGLITVGAGFSYTLYLIHYPLIIFLNGLDFPVNRWVMLIPILVITNSIAFALAYFTERKHKDLAKTIKRWLNLPQY